MFVTSSLSSLLYEFKIIIGDILELFALIPSLAQSGRRLKNKIKTKVLAYGNKIK